MTVTHGLRAAVVLAAASLLGGCAVPEFMAQGETVIDDGRPQGVPEGKIGDIFGPGGLVGGPVDPAASGVSVNRHLWLASLDTLSFLPLVSTDPFSGVIATDWATPEGSTDERFKVTVFVTEPALRASALRVAVFREVRRDGGWVSADVSDATPRRLEDAILTRARQLRVADLERGRRQG